MSPRSLSNSIDNYLHIFSLLNKILILVNTYEIEPSIFDVINLVLIN